MTNIDDILMRYSPGDPKHKTEVNAQVAALLENNKKRMEAHQKKKQEESIFSNMNKIVDDANTRVQEERGKAVRAIVQNKKLLLKIREYEKKLGIEADDAFRDEPLN